MEIGFGSIDWSITHKVTLRQIIATLIEIALCLYLAPTLEIVFKES